MKKSIKLLFFLVVTSIMLCACSSSNSSVTPKEELTKILIGNWWIYERNDSADDASFTFYEDGTVAMACYSFLQNWDIVEEEDGTLTLRVIAPLGDFEAYSIQSFSSEEIIATAISSWGKNYGSKGDTIILASSPDSVTPGTESSSTETTETAEIIYINPFDYIDINYEGSDFNRYKCDLTCTHEVLKQYICFSTRSKEVEHVGDTYTVYVFEHFSGNLRKLKELGYELTETEKVFTVEELPLPLSSISQLSQEEYDYLFQRIEDACYEYYSEEDGKGCYAETVTVKPIATYVFASTIPEAISARHAFQVIYEVTLDETLYYGAGTFNNIYVYSDGSIASYDIGEFKGVDFEYLVTSLDELLESDFDDSYSYEYTPLE